MALAVIFLLIFVDFGAAAPSKENQDPLCGDEPLDLPNFIPGELLVEFNDETIVNKKTTTFLVEDYSGLSIEIKENNKIAKVLVEHGTELNYCENLRIDHRVKHVEPNYITYVSKTPNDPKFNLQWGPQAIKCPDGWEYTTGDPNVKIAIIDTGVDYTHSDLAANCVSGYDFVDIDINNYLQMGYLEDPDEDYTVRDDNPVDVHSHGTHCAGIASAVTNNSIGIAGVGWSCKIIPVRAGFSLLWEHEGVTYKVGALEDEDIIDAIDYAADNDADVISMSFGSSSSSSLIESACNNAWNDGIILVASAGNEYRGSAGYPARYAKVIGVGAVDEDNERCDFSNYGAGLSMMAPGEDILSTVPGGGYDEYSGTSMACPHVAGVAALAISRFPNYTNPEIRDLLEDSADYIGPSLHYGNGLVDATFEIDAPPDTDEIVVTITMDYVKALDNIDVGSKEGEWFYELRVYDNYNTPTQTQKQVRYNKDYPAWLPFGWHSAKKWTIEDGVHQFTAYDGQAYVDVSIRLYDWDGISLSDIADVSACPNADGDWTWAIQELEGREYIIRYYLDDNRVSTIVNPCEDKIQDGEYYIGNGELDGSQGEEPWNKKRQDDAKVRYKITDNYIPPHSPGLDIIGFHKTDTSEWIEPGENVQFTATVADGAGPFTWELNFGDGDDIEDQTNNRESTMTHKYTLKNGKTRTLTKPNVWVTDRLGKYVHKYYPTSLNMYVTNPPYQPDGGKKGLIKYWAEAEDPEEDRIYYVFKWSSGSLRVPSSGFVESGTSVETLRKPSTSVIAVDEYGAESEEKVLPFSISNHLIMFLRRILENYLLLRDIPFYLVLP